MNADNVVISQAVALSAKDDSHRSRVRDGSEPQNTGTGHRQVIMAAVNRAGTWWSHQVEFQIDRCFVERLQQLRSLVPPLNALTTRRDLVIDKVRSRLPTARWRNHLNEDVPVEGSCLVVASDGTLSCAARCLGTRDRLQTLALPIAELVELDRLTSPGVVLIIRAKPGQVTRSV